jgi:transposase
VYEACVARLGAPVPEKTPTRSVVVALISAREGHQHLRRRHRARTRCRTAGLTRESFSRLLLRGSTPQIQFCDVDVEPVDVVEEPVGIVDDAAHRWGIAIPRLHRHGTLPQTIDEIVQLGEFG